MREVEGKERETGKQTEVVSYLHGAQGNYVSIENLPSGPVVKTPCFPCRGHHWIPCALQCIQKN